MDQNVLVKESLTQEMIAAGTGLVSYLDAHDWSPEAAFWYFDAEENRWRLYLASRKVETDGPRSAYEKIADAIQNKGITDFDLEDVSAISINDELPRALKKVIRLDGINTIRIQKSTVNGHFIPDMLIYRNR
jgi:hypothetical protein